MAIMMTASWNEEMRRVPSGIGAQAYFARYGIDFRTLTREIADCYATLATTPRSS